MIRLRTSAGWSCHLLFTCHDKLSHSHGSLISPLSQASCKKKHKFWNIGPFFRVQRTVQKMHFANILWRHLLINEIKGTILFSYRHMHTQTKDLFLEIWPRKRMSGILPLFFIFLSSPISKLINLARCEPYGYLPESIHSEIYRKLQMREHRQGEFNVKLIPIIIPLRYVHFGWYSLIRGFISTAGEFGGWRSHSSQEGVWELKFIGDSVRKKCG